MARILVVDDDEAFRNMLQQTLARAGYEVEAVSNGKLALEVQQLRPSDLIVTDIVMPEKEGTEMIIELRRLDPNAKIIAISGGGRTKPELNLKLATLLGAQATLTKPFTRQEILDVIAQVLSASGA